MNKIIIIPVLQFLSFTINSQVLPLDVTQKYEVRYEKFGSGVIYDFEKGENLSNSFAKEIFFEGKSAFQEGDYNEAKKKLLEFMEHELADKDINKNGFPNNLVLKYDACLMLKEIYYTAKNYRLSLYYDNLRRNYVYAGTCGLLSLNITSDDVYYFTCYEGSGRDERVISEILPKIFFSEPVDSGLVIRLYNLVNKNNNQEYLKFEMLKILDNIDITYIVINRVNKFLNHRLYVRTPTGPNLSDEEKKAIITEKIQNHLFYKLIMEN